MFGVIRALPRGASRFPMTSKRGHNYYKGDWWFTRQLADMWLTKCVRYRKWCHGSTYEKGWLQNRLESRSYLCCARLGRLHRTSLFFLPCVLLEKKRQLKVLEWYSSAPTFLERRFLQTPKLEHFITFFSSHNRNSVQHNLVCLCTFRKKKVTLCV